MKLAAVSPAMKLVAASPVMKLAALCPAMKLAAPSPAMKEEAEEEGLVVAMEAGLVMETEEEAVEVELVDEGGPDRWGQPPGV